MRGFTCSIVARRTPVRAAAVLAALGLAGIGPAAAAAHPHGHRAARPAHAAGYKVGAHAAGYKVGAHAAGYKVGGSPRGYKVG